MKKSSRKGYRHPHSSKSQSTPKDLRFRPEKSISTGIPPAIPGEFETQDALVFGCGQLVRYYPQLFVDFVRICQDRIRLVGIIAPEWLHLGRLLLGAAKLPIDAVEFIEGVTSSVWSRDWSPLLGYDGEGRRCQFYMDRSHMRHRDDLIARKLFQARFPDPCREVPLNMEGGNFLSNGQGLILTSASVAQTNAARYTGNKIAAILGQYFGSEQWASLPPLHGERTAHVDLFATFLAPDFLVIGSVNEKEDEINARSLDEAAAKLEGFSTLAGPLRIGRIPMPSSRDTYFRSYNNVIFANGLLLVPIYPNVDAKLDRRVLDIYREFLPGWEVMGLDLSSLATKGGGLHCLSTNVPPAVRVNPPAATSV